jgi:flagellar motility protein MotE (MotC chaperone)
MIGLVRDLRLIPIVLIASVCLLALKAADLFLGGDQPAVEMAPPAATLATAEHVVHVGPGEPPAEDRRSWAQQMFDFPNAGGAPAPPPANLVPPPLPAITSLASADPGNPDITGSVKTAEAAGDGKAGDGKGGDGMGDAAKGEAVKADAKGDAAKAGDGTSGSGSDVAKGGKLGKGTKLPDGTVIKMDGATLPASPGAEHVILERLQERREQLDTRARELDIREGLIAAAEKRVEARLAEIKEVEAHIAAAGEKKDEAESNRLKNLVSMYENMKPRDAAKIFDRLELSVLIDVASQMKPRTMADIMAQMSPDTAERLTVELASRAHATDKPNGELPKIEGHTMTP